MKNPPRLDVSHFRKGPPNNAASLLLDDGLKLKIETALRGALAHAGMDENRKLTFDWKAQNANDTLPDLSIAIADGKPCKQFHHLMRTLNLQLCGEVSTKSQQFTAEEIGKDTYRAMTTRDNTHNVNLIGASADTITLPVQENGLDKQHQFALHSAGDVRKFIRAVNNSVGFTRQIAQPARVEQASVVSR